MISRGEDVEAQALKNRGWSTSAIARHLGRDRKTIRAYLNGQREAGVRRSTEPDPLEPFTGAAWSSRKRSVAPMAANDAAHSTSWSTISSGLRSALSTAPLSAFELLSATPFVRGGPTSSAPWRQRRGDTRTTESVSPIHEPIAG